VLDAGDRRVYDVVADNSSRILEFIECMHGGAAYVLWANITDLLDDPFGPGSERLCHETAQKAASEWIELDRTSQAEIDTYFKRWNSREPWSFDS
jgi:hypothetical protein